MGGGDYKKSKIRNYIGNNFGLGANNFGGNIGLSIPEGNNYGLGTNKFGGNVDINFPQGRTLYVPVVDTSVPPPPPDTDIECYVGNNFGLAGFDFAQPYTISSVTIHDGIGDEASNKPQSPSVPPPVNPPANPRISVTSLGENITRSGNSNNGHSPGPRSYTIPSGYYKNAPNGLSTPPPNPPQPPSGYDMDTYVGSNYGFGGNKFDGTYNISIGTSQTSSKNPDSDHKPNKAKPHKPDPKSKPHKPQPCQPQQCHTASRSTYTLPGGGMKTSCPVCEAIWARNNSMTNYQALLRGDHIYS